LIGSFLLLFLLSTTCRIFAQSEDMNLWTRVAVKYDPTQKTRLALENEFRFYENISSLEQYHTEVGISQELTTNWDGGLYYRFMYEMDREKQYVIGHRAWVQLAYNWEKERFSVSYRTRLQTTYKGVFSSENGQVPESYSRNKLSFTYDLPSSKWQPSMGAEFWYRVNQNSLRFIDKYRISVSAQYRYSRNVRLEVFYNFQQQIQVADPATDHILGVAYTYLIR